MDGSSEGPGAVASGAMAVRVDDQGVVRLKWAAGVRVTRELARAAIDLVEQVTAGGQRPLLVEMSGTAGLTREARATFVDRSRVPRLALLGTSPVDRVLANFSLGLNDLPVPVRFFTSETAALAWLQPGRPAR